MAVATARNGKAAATRMSVERIPSATELRHKLNDGDTGIIVPFEEGINFCVDVFLVAAAVARHKGHFADFSDTPQDKKEDEEAWADFRGHR